MTFGRIDEPDTNWLEKLKERKSVFDSSFDDEYADRSFDLIENAEIEYAYKLITNLVLRNKPRDIDDIKLIFNIPAVRAYIQSKKYNNNVTVLEQLAKNLNNQDAIRLFEKLHQEHLDFTKLHPSVPRNIFKIIKVKDKPSQIVFPAPLPASYVDLRKYMDEHGDAYRKIIKKLADRLASWASQNGLPHDWVDEFMKKMNINQKTSDYFLRGIHPFLTQGILTLEQILFIIEDKKSCPQNAKDILSEVIDYIKLCGPGVHTRLTMARYQLVPDLNVELRENRRIVLNNMITSIAREIKREIPGVEISEGMEIHFGNVVANYFHEDLALVEIPDIYTERSADPRINEVTDLFILKFQARFFTAYTASSIIEKILSNIDLQAATDKIDWFWSRMNVYGPDKEFNVHDVFDIDDDTLKVTPAKNAQDILRISIFKRLVNSGVLPNLTEEMKIEMKTGKVIIGLYPYDIDLSYAVSKGVRVPLKDYLQQLVAENDLEEIDLINQNLLPKIKNINALKSYMQVMPRSLLNRVGLKVDEALTKTENIQTADDLIQYLEVMPQRVIKVNTPELHRLVTTKLKIDANFLFAQAPTVTLNLISVLDKQDLKKIIKKIGDKHQSFYDQLSFEQKRNYLVMLTKLEIDPFKSVLGNASGFPMSPAELRDFATKKDVFQYFKDFLDLFSIDLGVLDQNFLVGSNGKPLSPSLVQAQIDISFRSRCKALGFDDVLYEKVNMMDSFGRVKGVSETGRLFMPHIIAILHPTEMRLSSIYEGRNRYNLLDYCEKVLKEEYALLGSVIYSAYVEKIKNAEELCLFLKGLPASVVTYYRAPILYKLDRRFFLDIYSILSLPPDVSKAVIDMLGKDRLQQIIDESEDVHGKNFKKYCIDTLITSHSKEKKQLHLYLADIVGIDLTSRQTVEKVRDAILEKHRDFPISILDSIGSDSHYDPIDIKGDNAEKLSQLMAITLRARLQQGRESVALTEMKHGNDTIYLNKNEFSFSYAVVNGKRQLLEDYLANDLALQERIVRQVDFKKNRASRAFLVMFLKAMPLEEIVAHVPKEELIKELFKDTLVHELSLEKSKSIIDMYTSEELAPYLTNLARLYESDGVNKNDFSLLVYMMQKTQGDFNQVLPREKGRRVAHMLVINASQYKNMPERLAILVKAGLNLNVPSIGGEYPLTLAVQQRNLAVFRALIRQGADISKPYKNNVKATLMEHLSLAEAAFGAGVDQAMYEFALGYDKRKQLAAMPSDDWKELDKGECQGLIRSQIADLSFITEVANSDEKRKQVPKLFGKHLVVNLFENFFLKRKDAMVVAFEDYSNEQFRTFFHLAEECDQLSANLRKSHLLDVLISMGNNQALVMLHDLGENLATTTAIGSALKYRNLDILKTLTALGVDLFAGFDDVNKKLASIKEDNDPAIYQYMYDRHHLIEVNQKRIIDDFESADSNEIKKLIDDHQLGLPFLLFLSASPDKAQKFIDSVGIDHLNKFIKYCVGNDLDKIDALSPEQFIPLMQLSEKIPELKKAITTCALRALDAGEIEKLNLLYENKFDFGREPGLKTGETCVHLAVNGKNTAMIKWMIEKQIDLTQPNQYGLTPLDLAQDLAQSDFSYNAVIKLLRNAIAAQKARGVSQSHATIFGKQNKNAADPAPNPPLNKK